VELLIQQRRRGARCHNIRSEIVQLDPLGPCRTPQCLERVVGVDRVTLCQNPFRLLDDDARLQRVLELRAATREDPRELDEAADCGLGLGRRARRQ
jgi:hypothetical protein